MKKIFLIGLFFMSACIQTDRVMTKQEKAEFLANIYLHNEFKDFKDSLRIKFSKLDSPISHRVSDTGSSIQKNITVRKEYYLHCRYFVRNKERDNLFFIDSSLKRIDFVMNQKPMRYRGNDPMLKLLDSFANYEK